MKTRNKDTLKLCSVCSMDWDEECGYHGNLHCNYKEKIQHKQTRLIGC